MEKINKRAVINVQTIAHMKFEKSFNVIFSSMLQKKEGIRIRYNCFSSLNAR